MVKYFVCCVYCHGIAGHPKHEWTSYSSFESVFRFFEEKYRRRASGVDEEDEGSKKQSCTLL